MISFEQQRIQRNLISDPRFAWKPGMLQLTWSDYYDNYVGQAEVRVTAKISETLAPAPHTEPCITDAATAGVLLDSLAEIRAVRVEYVRRGHAEEEEQVVIVRTKKLKLDPWREFEGPCLGWAAALATLDAWRQDARGVAG